MGGLVRSAAPAAIAWMIAASASAQASSELAPPDAAETPTPHEASVSPPAIDERAAELPEEVSLEIPPAPDLELDTMRLGILLEDRALQEAEGQAFGGILSLGLGALEVGAGLWLVFDDGTFASLDSLRWTAAALAIPLGALAMASGVASLSMAGVQRERLRRWRLAMDGGLDARALGRFEGELRAEAETARVFRGFEAAAGFGLTGGGAVLMLATALSSADELGQLYGYGMGGALATAGLISALVALLVQSDAEDTWSAYLAGEGPDTAATEVDLSVTPTVSEEGFGLSLQGRF